MGGWPAKDLPSLIMLLLPGFISASIFYTLTAHPKTTEFERLIQALIFTVLIQPFTAFVKWTLLHFSSDLNLFGRSIYVGPWTRNVELTWSIIIAFLLGVGFALFANKDWFHWVARCCRLTKRTSFPSEWYSAFASEERWVVLHLTGNRILKGWPIEWPDQPDKGHFVIGSPAWILDDGSTVPVYQTKKLIIASKDVEIVEFLNLDLEITASPEDVASANDRLLALRRKEK